MSSKLKVAIIIIFVLANLLMMNLSIVKAATLEEEAQRRLEYDTEAFIQEAGLGERSVALIVSDIIKILLSFLGVIFIVLIIYAGFSWLTSAGNEEKIEKAKKIMVSAIVGLVIILSAWVITYFVIDKILEATIGRQGLDTIDPRGRW
jgi:hypothetical protein